MVVNTVSNVLGFMTHQKVDATAVSSGVIKKGFEGVAGLMRGVVTTDQPHCGFPDLVKICFGYRLSVLGD